MSRITMSAVATPKYLSADLLISPGLSSAVVFSLMSPYFLTFKMRTVARIIMLDIAPDNARCGFLDWLFTHHVIIAKGG